jgi:hypothetical protein
MYLHSGIQTRSCKGYTMLLTHFKYKTTIQTSSNISVFIKSHRKIGKQKKKKEKDTHQTRKRIFTCEKLESSWSTSPLCSPNQTLLFIHVKPRINHYRPRTILANRETRINDTSNNQSSSPKQQNKNQ